MIGILFPFCLAQCQSERSYRSYFSYGEIWHSIASDDIIIDLREIFEKVIS